MKGYVLSVDAELDLDEIWEFIAQDKIDAADRWIGRLFEAFEAIANAPGIGHTRKDLTEYPILFWPVSAYLILYRTRVDGVEIVAVTQGARDIPSFLHQRNASYAPEKS
jgi:plasmid stabilization system protein ParE